jgi:hypothetical protein
MVGAGLVSAVARAAQEEPQPPSRSGTETAQQLRSDTTPPARLAVGGATFAIEWDPGLADSASMLQAWIVSAARTVSGYYGRFPADRVTLRLVARPAGGVGGGVTTNDDGARITVRVGTAITSEQLAADWVLVHEMVHLALPEVGRRHNWLSEGLATYVEGIARAQAGARPATDVWSEFTRSMPKGLPQPGEGGLDETHTWARTYWGGALFCLLADVAIREQTRNRRSLRDALAAISRSTGGYAGPSAPRGVPIEEVLRLGDEATGTRVLVDLYERMKASAAAPDMAMLWDRLGIRGEGDHVEFDERAPLAAIRAAMTAQIKVAPAGTH